MDFIDFTSTYISTRSYVEISDSDSTISIYIYLVIAYSVDGISTKFAN
jgi:hypothetical protein